MTIVNKQAGLSGTSAAVKENLDIVEGDVKKLDGLIKQAKESIKDPVKTTEALRAIKQTGDQLSEDIERLEKHG